MKKLFVFILSSIFLLSLSSAHVIPTETGLAAGLLHPLFGIDHLLALVAVGILSVRNGKVNWLIPIAFVSFMVLGGVLGVYGIAVPGVEYGIALSVLMLGLAVASSYVLPIQISMAFMGLFAFFHGHAHGYELPLLANSAYYLAGMVLTTIILHVSGVLIAREAQKTEFTTRLLRISGIAMSLVGVALLLSI